MNWLFWLMVRVAEFVLVDIPDRLGTPDQFNAWLDRWQRPWYTVEFILHVVLGYAAMRFPPLWGFILYRELAQACSGDGMGRPSATTGWWDPMTDVVAYVLGACLALWACRV